MTATKKPKQLAGICLCFLCFFVAASAQTPTVTKVDPPSWWARHTINPVRLLIRGSNLHGAKVTSMNPELRASKISVNDRGTYLFVDVEISPSLRPGKYPLLVESEIGRAHV